VRLVAPLALPALLALSAACTRTPPPKPVGNVATTAPPLAIDADTPLGWLALGTVRAPDGSWIPVSAQVGAITLTDDPLPPRVTVIPSSGPAELLTVGEAFPLHYGCDNNELGVRPLAGPRIAPGPAWILPPDVAWRPTSLALSRTHADPTRRAHAAGRLVFELTRTDSSHASLAITRDGTPVLTSVFARAEMDGANNTGPVDLTEQAPGMPEPIAAWSFSPSGPELVVLLVPGYEGVNLTTYLVEQQSARAIEGMEQYLYQCAF
jgi:hypothetical protein